MSVQFRWQDLIQEGERFLIGRHFFSSDQMNAVHTHDYAEVWWMDEGQGIHQVNGTRVQVRPGDLVMVRPDDCHAFGAGQFSITNLAIDHATLNHLCTRYFCGNAQFWGGADRLPHSHHLSSSQLHTLRIEADRLALHRDSLLQLDRFVLNLLDLLAQSEIASSSRSTNLPSWLDNACQQIRQPEYLRLGAPAFFQLAGKSPEHVARVVRKTLNTTPMQLVIDARMAYAALLLDMTPKSILDIAGECGYESLSRFYNLFKATYNMTPRQYRRRSLNG